ncbi:peptidase family C54-domain-containing protein [Schizophyllum fasciatum]
MGLQHPGFPPPPEPLETIPDVGERSPSDRLSPTDTRFRQSPGSPRSSIIRSATKRRSPTISGAIGSPPSSFHPPSSPTRGSPSGIGLSSSAHASTPSLQQPSASASSVVLATGAADPNLSPTSVEALAAASGWPQEFFSDFASRLWLTYRSGFAPIRDMSLEDLDPPRSGALSTLTSALTGRRGLTSDAGWGCMLRTGQSLLANALVVAWMGRANLALYIHLLSLFLDSPSPSAPFSVHRMALAGRELGKDVGQWFGPSTAAGAIKALLNAYPDAGLGVAVVEDGAVYQTHRRQKDREHEWGDRPVLILLGTRLGIDGVNPMYYDTIKQLYTLPQSLGIAGGRPSSSYYFVGAQAGELFYLDPHHARPTVPLREVGEVKISATSPAAQGAEPGAAPDALSPPKEGLTRSATTDKKRSKKEKRLSFDTDVEKSDAGGKVSKHKRRHSQHLAAALANASAASSMSSASVADEPAPAAAPLPPPFIPQEPVPVPLPPHSTAPTLPPALAAHYLAGYTAAETRTFHCERVRKMPMSGLDPSMLIGFLCKDRADWDDWRARMGKLSKFPLSIQDEPPNWMPSDVESMSDELIYDDDESEITDGGEGEGQGDDFEGEARPTRRKIDARRLSEDLPLDDNDNSSEATSTSRTEDEDNVDPVTPGPHDTRFSIPEPQGRAKDLCVDDMTIDDLGGAGDIEDDWVEPSPPPTRHSSSTSPPPNATVASPPSIASAPSSTSSSSPPPLAKKKGKRKEKSRAVPVPRVSIPDSAPVAFPRSDAKGDEDEWTEGDEVYYSARDNERSDDAFVNVHVKPKERRMHTARARDGGRTQSGGVRGIMTESSS